MLKSVNRPLKAAFISQIESKVLAQRRQKKMLFFFFFFAIVQEKSGNVMEIKMLYFDTICL